MTRAIVLVLLLLPGVASAQLVGRSAPPAPRTTAGYGVVVRTPGPDSHDIRERIGDGRRSGQLSRGEARQLRRETGQLDTLAARYGADGLSAAEARELQVRAEVLRDQVNTRRTAGFGGPRPQRGR